MEKTRSDAGSDLFGGFSPKSTKSTKSIFGVGWQVPGWYHNRPHGSVVGTNRAPVLLVSTG
jgi:hypothetical protein